MQGYLKDPESLTMSGFYEGILLCRKKEIGVFSVKFWRALHVLPLQEFKIQYTVSAPRNDQIVHVFNMFIEIV